MNSKQVTTLERNAAIFEAVVRGKTYPQVADKYEITPSRAYQITVDLATELKRPKWVHEGVGLPYNGHPSVYRLRQYSDFWLERLAKWRRAWDIRIPRHVGDSRFETWYSEYRQPTGAGEKQRMRDAYAAGMSDPGACNLGTK
jgi:hypothetical protein